MLCALDFDSETQSIILSDGLRSVVFPPLFVLISLDTATLTLSKY